MEGLDEWVNANHGGGDEVERAAKKNNIKDLWMELSEGVETPEGMDMLEKIKEEKLQVVADMSAREIAEGRQRQGRGSSESYSIVDAISNMQK
jgi:hypothetical protein